MDENTKRQLIEALSENKGRLVAEFFERYPRADPRRLRLITLSRGDETVFYLEYAQPTTAIKTPGRKVKRANSKKRGA